MKKKYFIVVAEDPTSAWYGTLEGAVIELDSIEPYDNSKAIGAQVIKGTCVYPAHGIDGEHSIDNPPAKIGDPIISFSYGWIIEDDK